MALSRAWLMHAGSDSWRRCEAKTPRRGPGCGRSKEGWEPGLPEPELPSGLAGSRLLVYPSLLGEKISMNISISEVEEVTVVMFKGNLDTGTAPEAQAKLDELMATGTTKLLVDCSELDYISSAGLGVMLVYCPRNSCC